MLHKDHQLHQLHHTVFPARYAPSALLSLLILMWCRSLCFPCPRPTTIPPTPLVRKFRRISQHQTPRLPSALRRALEQAPRKSPRRRKDPLKYLPVLEPGRDMVNPFGTRPSQAHKRLSLLLRRVKLLRRVGPEFFAVRRNHGRCTVNATRSSRIYLSIGRVAVRITRRSRIQNVSTAGSA